MAMSSAPARPGNDTSARRTVTIRGHVPPPPQPAASASLRDVDVPPRRLESRRPAPISLRPSIVPAASTPVRPAGALASSRQRPSRPMLERMGGAPDRLAMWAFVMAVFLVIVATISAS